jgi:hypothetical protein
VEAESLRQYFADLSAQIANVADDAKAAAETSREAARTSRSVQAELLTIGAKVDRLEKVVFGGDPPPDLPPTSASVLARVSSAEADDDDLRGKLAAIEGRVAHVEKLNVDQSKVLADQSKAMGVGRHGFAFLRSREGQKLLLQLAILLLTIYAATGRTTSAVPPPTSVHEQSTAHGAASAYPFEPFLVPP